MPSSDTAWGQFQFSPVGYFLDAAILQGRFTIIGDETVGVAGPPASDQVTLADILLRTRDHQVGDINTGSASAFAAFPPAEPHMDPDRLRQVGAHAHLAVITTSAGYLVVAGTAFNCQVAKLFLEFRSKGINPLDTTWFWYDSARVLEDPHELHSFFVIHGNAIVHERVRLSDAPGYAFDAGVFRCGDSSEVWSDDNGWRDAEVRFWYRRFYRDTVTGQLMVLRSDNPPLFHYPEGQLARLLYAQPASDDREQLRILKALLGCVAQSK